MYRHIHNLGLSTNDKEEDQFDQDFLDETIVAAIQSGQEKFIEGLEEFLNVFIEDTEK